MKTLSIIPFSRECGNAEIAVDVPGSKSITNRAMILAALKSGTTKLTNVLFSEDTRAMIECLRELGFKIEADESEKTISIRGNGGKIPRNRATLYVATAGTTARFLTAMLALCPDGEFELDGSPVMRKRPMKGLLDALKQLGCNFEFHGESDCFPFTMRTRGICKKTVEVDASASSQILSALMLIAPIVGLKIKLAGTTVSKPFLILTAKMIEQFGGEIRSRGSVWSSAETGYASKQRVYAIEPDATAASYFAVRAIANGVDSPKICINNLQSESIQGDIKFYELLCENNFVAGAESNAGMHFANAGTPPAAELTLDFNAISDTFLSLAAFVLLTKTAVTITGIAHTRKQESDRVHAMATELAKIIGKKNVTETEDMLTIIPPKNLAETLAKKSLPIAIDTYKDHRIAMCFGMLGTVDVLGNGKPWLAINDPECCAKTFPNFFEVLDAMRNH